MPVVLTDLLSKYAAYLIGGGLILAACVGVYFYVYDKGETAGVQTAQAVVQKVTNKQITAQVTATLGTIPEVQQSAVTIEKATDADLAKILPILVQPGPAVVVPPGLAAGYLDGLRKLRSESSGQP